MTSGGGGRHYRPAAEPPPADETETTDRIAGLPMELRRQTVTVLPPVHEPAPEPETERPSLFSVYNIGTVPASVTPPPSWRKAAWFAMVSSAGVAVALMAASTLLVEQQQSDKHVQGWTGLRGNDDLIGDETAPEPTGTPRPTTSSGAKKPQVIGDVAGVRPSPGPPPTTSSAQRQAADRGSTPTTPRGTTSTKRSTSAEKAPTTTQRPKRTTTPPKTTRPEPERPKKPTAKPAKRETERALLSLSDTDKMGDRTETFFNEITEHPKKAHAQTTGELRAEGAKGIAERYKRVAFFEVERVLIDQRSRETISTLRTTYADGTVKDEQRTLRFDFNGYIAKD